jgi:hypothetical protein
MQISFTSEPTFLFDRACSNVDQVRRVAECARAMFLLQRPESLSAVRLSIAKQICIAGEIGLGLGSG